MILAALRYALSALIVLAGKAATFVLAPLACLFVAYREESETTGYPSQFPGKPRAFLARPLRWMQSFDDCLDAYWYSGRASWMGYDQAYYDTHSWLRWACAVLWVWRNPAYGLAHALGFDQRGLEYLRDDDPVDIAWSLPSQSCSLWRVAKNASGQYGFLYRARVFYFRSLCAEVVMGWKIPWDNDPADRAMLAVRISLFKRYG